MRSDENELIREFINLDFSDDVIYLVIYLAEIYMTYMTHGQEGMEIQINGMDRWMSLPEGKYPYFGMKLSMVLPQEWNLGKTAQLQNGLMVWL